MALFCGIYGVGAVIIIVLSQYFDKNNFSLFLGGCFIGAAVEYIVSFLVEVIISTKWWDYSNNILSINGRICLIYSAFWGILTIFLIKKINPLIDKMIYKIKEKISIRILKSTVLVFIAFLFIDCIITCYAQNAFINRMIVNHNIEVDNMQQVWEEYNNLYANKKLSKSVETIWSDKKMIRTFPNIKIEDKNNNVIYLDSLLPDIKTYYFKVFEK